MIFENSCAHGCSRLEEIASHCTGTHAEQSRDIARVVALEIDEVECFALPRGQFGEEVPDVLCYLLPVDASAGVGVVDVVCLGEHRFGKHAPPAILPVLLQCYSPHDSIDPRFD